METGCSTAGWWAARRRALPGRDGRSGEARRSHLGRPMNALGALRGCDHPVHRDRLGWAVRVRWLVIGGFLALGLAAYPFGLFPHVRACCGAALVGALLNGANDWCVRRSRWVGLVTAIAIPMDSVLITYVIARSGGVQSPFVMMYTVQVVTTAMLVTFGAAMASVTIAACAFAGLLVLDRARLVAISPLYAPWRGVEDAAALGGAAWFGFLLYCLLLLIFVGGYVSRRLRWSEHQLARKNRRLEATVASLQRARDELAQAYRRLQDAEAHLVQSGQLEAIGLVAAGVAHELNNPLSFVAASVEHLRGYFGCLMEAVDRCRDLQRAGVPPALCVAPRWGPALEAALREVPETLDDCEEGARRAAQVVEELRAFSRGGAESEWGPVDVNRGIRSTVALLRGRLRQGIQVHLHLDPVPAVHGSAGQLNQVFLNLLVNAADAIGGNGGIWIDSRHDGAARLVRIRVRDDGRGIAPEHLGRVFDPFFTTKPTGKATGLGLSVSLAIVRRLGGTLVVDSVPGRGTVFEIAVPAGERSAAAPE